MTKQCDKDEVETVLGPYLVPRDDGKSRNIYVRMTAPKDIQKILPKSQHQYRASLGTTDVRKANIIGGELVARKLREWEALRKSFVPEAAPLPILLSEQLISQIVGARMHAWVNTDDEDRYLGDGLDDDEFAAIDAFCKYTDATMRSVIARGVRSPEYATVIESIIDWCDALNYLVEPTDPLFPSLVRQFAEVEKKAQQFIAGRNAGDSPEVTAVLPREGTYLSEMTEIFFQHKSQTVGRKPVSTAVSIWKRFIEFKGDVFLDDVNSNDIYNFFEFKLFNAEEKWSQQYVDGHVKRALKNVFALARSKSLMTVNNPVLSLEVAPKLSQKQKKARSKPRFPLTTNFINALLTSQWYNPTSRSFRGKMKTDLGVRYFGPLIGILHGPRIREPLQLMTNDIIYCDGVLCFKFTVEFEDDDSDTNPPSGSEGSNSTMDLPDRSLKNESTHRTIPIHPKLIELGFAEYWEKLKSISFEPRPLFPSSVPEMGGINPIWGRAYEQALLRHMKDDLKFPEGYSSHGFRHQFEDRIRAAQVKKIWPAGVSQLLSGRRLPRDKDRDVFREMGSEQDYGEGYLPSAVLPYLEELVFSDIIFPEKFQNWLSKAGIK